MVIPIDSEAKPKSNKCNIPTCSFHSHFNHVSQVRIKAARNLASLTPTISTTRTPTPSNASNLRFSTSIPSSPRSSPATAAAAALESAVILPDAYVTVSLG
jgi:hypothetical protein